MDTKFNDGGGDDSNDKKDYWQLMNRIREDPLPKKQKQNTSVS